MRARIDQLGGAEAPRRHHARPVSHLAVSQGRAVLDDQDALAAHVLAALDEERRGSLEDRGARIQRLQILADGLHVGVVGGIDFVQHEGICHADVRLAGIVGELVTRAMRIGDHDVQIGDEEGQIVVAAIPQDDIRLVFGAGEDGGVIHAGEDHVTVIEVRLVLLALLDGGLVQVEVGVAAEALHGLLAQIAVGHRMAHHDDAPAQLAQARAT